MTRTQDRTGSQGWQAKWPLSKVAVVLIAFPLGIGTFTYQSLFIWTPLQRWLWLSKTRSELKTRKSRLHADNSLLEKLIEVSVQQRCNGVLNRKAWSAEKNPVSARDEIALVHKTNGSYRRRGPTNSKRRGVGIDDGVLRPEESLRCARVLASPRLSIPEHLWPAPDEFGNAGDRQNSFAECGVTIFDSIR